MTKIAKPTAIIAPSFAPVGTKLVNAFKAFDLASVRMSGSVSAAMQQYVDHCVVEGLPRNEDGCKAIRKAVALACDEGRGALATAIATGAMERKTLIEYSQSAQRAFFHNVAWSAALKNDPAFALPWGKAHGTTGGVETEAKKAGAVSTTTAEELQKTLLKAIEQARLLNMRDFANELGSFVGNYLDAFKFESKSE